MARWPKTVRGKLFLLSIVVAAFVLWMSGSAIWAAVAVLAIASIALLIWYRPVGDGREISVR
jgi:hypothetical protein